jgi:preprotein translocase SecE subunit
MAEKKKIDAALAQARQRAERLAKAGPGNSPASAKQFIKETVVELKKTHWPDTNILSKSVSVVLVFILATAIWVGSLDFVLKLVGDHIFLGNTK